MGRAGRSLAARKLICDAQHERLLGGQRTVQDCPETRLPGPAKPATLVAVLQECIAHLALMPAFPGSAPNFAQPMRYAANAKRARVRVRRFR